MVDFKSLRSDFPILKNLVYLDSAATSQKPNRVLDAINHYYAEVNANVHRGIYRISEEATKMYEEAHSKVAMFIGCSFEEIVFTRNTTESLNLLAYCLSEIVEEGRDEIVVTALEHHSNLVPWQEVCKRKGWKLKVIPLLDDLTLDYGVAREMINSRTAIVSFVHISNALGTVNDIDFLVKLAKNVGAYSIVDGAQSIHHTKINVEKIGCDFFAFSGHKMYGPTGIGVLFGRKEILAKMPPFMFGGDMISRVSYKDADWNELPWKFEAGTPHIAGGIGLAAAVDYISGVGMENIEKYEGELLDYALNRLSEVEGIVIYSAGSEKSKGVISFNLDGIHPHDVASILDKDGICVRAGNHCTMPLMDRLGIGGTCRISLALYNTNDDIDKLIDGLNKVRGVFDGHL